MKTVTVLSRLLLVALTVFVDIGFSQSSTIQGIINTYAGPGLPVSGWSAVTQPMDSPGSIAVDAAGNFYVSSNDSRIYRVSPAGALTVFAGTGSAGFSGDDGLALSARVGNGASITVDSSGNLYIADRENNRVRRVGSNGIITTVAGSGPAGSGIGGFSGDGGPATSAQLNAPNSVAVDAAGNLYISDSGNFRVRKVTVGGIISTVAGGGNASGENIPAITALVVNVTSIAVDSAGNLFLGTAGKILKVNAAGLLSTFAGSLTQGFFGDGGSAVAARLSQAQAIAVDSLGNVFFADLTNHRIRKITAIGTISTVAGTGSGSFSGDGGVATAASLFYPSGVALDAAGNLYIADTANSRIRKVTGGSINTVAGDGPLYDFRGDGGPAVLARMYYTEGVAVDAAGTLYIADSGNNRIRKVTAAGVISTVAGNGGGGFTGDGTALNTAFSPQRVAVDAAGNLFVVADARVLKITPGGALSTYAGPPLAVAGTTAVSQAFDFPGSIASDGAGNFYFSTDNRVYRVSTTGTLTIIAGTGTAGFSGDGGAAMSAQIGADTSLAVDQAGNVYIADRENHRIRKVTAGGIISTVAGSGPTGFGAGALGGDAGPATSARLNEPVAVAVDSTGNLFIADQGNFRIRKVETNGVMTTVAGGGTSVAENIAATSAFIVNMSGVAVDSSGALYIGTAGKIFKVNISGVISTYAGSNQQGFSGDGASASKATLATAEGLVVDSSGNLFFADVLNQRIRKISAQGNNTITTVAGSGASGVDAVGDFSGDGGPATLATFSIPRAVAVDSAGNLYIADGHNARIRKVSPSGTISTVAGTGPLQGFSGDGGPAVGARMYAPDGLAVDSSGNLFIADSGNNRIRKVTPAGVISTVAGTGENNFSGDGAPAVAARLSSPGGVAVDTAGNLFIADTGNNRIRKISSSGIITTIAGTGEIGVGGDGGAAVSAQLSSPTDLSVDAAGNLFINDSSNFRIRKLSAAGIISTVAGTGVYGTSEEGVPATAAAVAPIGVAVDSSGNVYISEDARVRRITFRQLVSFSFADRGGNSVISSGAPSSATVGYATVRPNAGATTPSGLAVFGLTQNGVLVTEAGAPAVPVLQSGRIYAEVGPSVNTGLAIVNPNNQEALVSFYFTDSSGGDFRSGTTILPANGKITTFLDQPPFYSGNMIGSFTFNSNLPIAALAIRGLNNERGEFLITTLPVADLSIPAGTGTVTFPQFAEGGGWVTQIVLVNTGETALSGTAQFLDASGAPVTVAVGNQAKSSFAYSIPPRTSQKLTTSGTGNAGGSVRVTPASGSNAPTGLVIFSEKNGSVTVAEAGVPSSPGGNAFRLYVETNAVFGSVGSIQTGLAVTNNSGSTAQITLELMRLDGSSTGLVGTLPLPANGQKATFLFQIPEFASLPTPFQGILRVSSPASISVVGLRGRYNERRDFLITTTPTISEVAPPTSSVLYFPQIVDGGGYTTQFVVFSGQAGQSSAGFIQLISATGGALNWTFK